MYFPHRNDKLHQLFSYKPYQGADPAAARFLFFVLDANFHPDIGNEPYFPEIISYLEDGVQYWKQNGFHHPFRHPEYRGDGSLYHRRFAEIGFTAAHADQVSFVELIDVPTYGRSNLQFSDLKASHLSQLYDWTMEGEASYIFIPSGVSRLLRQTSQFSWLPKSPVSHDGSLPVLFRSDRKIVYAPFHFSCIGRGCLKKDLTLQLRDIARLIF